MHSEQLDILSQLHQDGYVLIRDVIDRDALARIDRETCQLIADWNNGLTRHPDYWSFKLNDLDILYRIHNFEMKKTSILSVIDTPAFSGLLCHVMGPSPRPTAYAMVIKMSSYGAAVPWHRDPVDVPQKQVYNFSIYLDESTPDDGCFADVPGSHLDKIQILDETRPPPGAKYIGASPSDVLVHDVRLVHGSSASHSDQMRRSILHHGVETSC